MVRLSSVWGVHVELLAVDESTLSATVQLLQTVQLELTWHSAKMHLRKSRKHGMLGVAVGMVAGRCCQCILDRQSNNSSLRAFLEQKVNDATKLGA